MFEGNCTVDDVVLLHGRSFTFLVTEISREVLLILALQRKVVMIKVFCCGRYVPTYLERHWHAGN